MRKRSFFGPPQPAFSYELATGAMVDPVPIPTPARVTVYIKKEYKLAGSQLKPGTAVVTGQRLTLDEGDDICAIASVTGTIAKVEPFLADYGQSWAAVTIETAGEDAPDDDFSQACQTPSLETLRRYLAAGPGEPDIAGLMDAEHPVRTLVIYGGNADILVDTGLFMFKQNAEAINRGVDILKTASGIDDVVIVVPEESVQNFSGHLNARIQPVPSRYPYAQPLMVAYHLTGRLPDERGLAAMGIHFIRAEAVATIGTAFGQKTLPVKKSVAVFDKEGTKHLAIARIGTPVGALLDAFGIEIHDHDKIIFGGPMTGQAIFSLDQPIRPDTDAIIVQDHSQVPLYSDYPCINCGDCVRVCPANVPVNLLVRFLEAGQYNEGAELYDLFSCIECGLCSYVCPSRIPVYQYIKLAKYELGRTFIAEEMNELE